MNFEIVILKIFLLSTLIFSEIDSDVEIDWQLVWADEFESETLNEDYWKYDIDCNGGGNNELQCYTRRPENLEVVNGSLIITAKPEIYDNHLYTSARIKLRQLAWKYGKFEARVRFPLGQ